MKADGLTILGNQQNIVVPTCNSRSQYFIFFPDGKSHLAFSERPLVFGDSSLFDLTLLGNREYGQGIVHTGEIGNRQNGCYLFTFAQLQKIDDSPAKRSSAGLGQLIDLAPEYTATVGEKEEGVKRRGGIETAYKVVLQGAHALDSLAAAVLGAIKAQGITFDVAAVGDGDDHFFRCNQVFRKNFIRFIHDFSTAFVTIIFLYFLEFFPNYLKEQFTVCQYFLIPFDLLQNLLIILDNFFPLKAG